MIVVYGYNAASHCLGVVCILGAEGCVLDVDSRDSFSLHHTITIGLPLICKFVTSLRRMPRSFCIERVDPWLDGASGHDESNVQNWGVGAIRNPA